MKTLGDYENILLEDIAESLMDIEDDLETAIAMEEELPKKLREDKAFTAMMTLLKKVATDMETFLEYEECEDGSCETGD